MVVRRSWRQNDWGLESGVVILDEDWLSIVGVWTDNVIDQGAVRLACIGDHSIIGLAHCTRRSIGVHVIIVLTPANRASLVAGG